MRAQDVSAVGSDLTMPFMPNGVGERRERERASAATVYDRGRSLLARETGGSHRCSVSFMFICDQKLRPDKALERLSPCCNMVPDPA